MEKKLILVSNYLFADQILNTIANNLIERTKGIAEDSAIAIAKGDYELSENLITRGEGIAEALKLIIASREFLISKAEETTKDLEKEKVS